jgi:hypothetical protein
MIRPFHSFPIRKKRLSRLLLAKVQRNELRLFSIELRMSLRLLIKIYARYAYLCHDINLDPPPFIYRVLRKFISSHQNANSLNLDNERSTR